MADPGKILSTPEIAQAWARITITRWQDKIRKLKFENPDHLLNSFVRDVINDARGDQVKIQLAFNFYGRFVDMGVGRGVKIGNVKENATSRRLEGKMLGNRRRPRKWYSKTLRAETLRLTEILAQQYGRSVIDMILQNFVLTTEENGK
jgi:hypothetical protein